MIRALYISLLLALTALSAQAQAPVEKPAQKETSTPAATNAPASKPKVQNTTDDSKRDELTKKLQQRKLEIKQEQVVRSKNSSNDTPKQPAPKQ